MDKDHTFERVMKAVDMGLRKARDEINKSMPDDQPSFEYGIIVCAMRFFNEHFSEYYRMFAHATAYSSERQRIQYASLELARATSRLKDETDIQVVGFDLAGSEYGYPADNHRKAYDIVHKHFIHKTVHAGEAYGPESIFKAITSLHAERIGHGLFMFDDKMIFNEKIANKKKYISELVNYVAERRITIEVCLTSNLQTVPQIKSLKTHSLKRMLENRLSVTLCTDNRLVSHTTVTREIKLALDNFEISPSMLKDIVLYGFKRSFYYQPYHQKRKYVRSIINYYEKLEDEFGIRN
jgi:adenosine deaminase